MRFASSVAVALLLVVAASASMLRGAPRGSRTDFASGVDAFHHRHGAAAQQQRSVGDNNAYGEVYRLVYELSMAAMTKNTTTADDILDEYVYIIDPSISCQQVSKAKYLADSIANPYTQAGFTQLGEWVGVQGNAGIFRATAAVVLADNAGALSNQTVVRHDIIIYAMLNDAGTKLAFLEIGSPRAQDNATAMVGVWNDLVDAAQLRDASAWAPYLADDASMYTFYAFGQFAPTQALNKTAIIDDLTNGWADNAVMRIDTEFAFAFCDFVWAQVIYSGIDKQGQATVNRIGFSIAFNEDMKVANINQYAMQIFA